MYDYLIYSIEDDNEISSLISLVLTKSGFKVVSFEDGESFLETFKSKKPNLILLDLMLPGIQGIDLLKIIRSDENNDNIPILIVSAKSLIEDKILGFDIGCDDYIEKPFNILELKKRVEMNYKKYLKSKNLIEIDNYLLDNKNNKFYLDNKEIELTRSEFKILSLLFTKKGEVVSRNELSSLFNKEKDESSRVIDMHIKSIRKKINDNDSSFIESIYGEGYKIK